MSRRGQAFGFHILTPLLPIRTLLPKYGYNVTRQHPDLATFSSLLAAMSSLSMTDHISLGQRARKQKQKDHLVCIKWPTSDILL